MDSNITDTKNNNDISITQTSNKDFPCQKTDSTGQLVLTDCLVENSALEVTIILVVILLILLVAVVLVYFNASKKEDERRNDREQSGSNYYEYDESKKSFIETQPPRQTV